MGFTGAPGNSGLCSSLVLFLRHAWDHLCSRISACCTCICFDVGSFLLEIWKLRSQGDRDGDLLGEKLGRSSGSL